MFFQRQCKITFICHGTTINTEENRFFDNEKFPPINETGREEMKKISLWIENKGLKIDNIFSSPALRCVQSCSILSEHVHQDFETISSLSGRKIGSWSGLSIEDITKKSPNQIQQFFKEAETFWPENGESLANFNSRILNSLNEIINNNIQKRIIIVTSADVIQAAAASALNIPLNSQFKIYIPSGSATQISYFKDFASLIYSAYIPS